MWIIDQMYLRILVRRLCLRMLSIGIRIIIRLTCTTCKRALIPIMVDEL